MSDFRFAPIENPDTEVHWAGVRDGKLLIQKCSSCATHRYPPSPICHACHDEAHEWIEASGRGTVWSYSVVHEPLDGWPGEVPYIVVIIALEEGVKIVSNLLQGSHDRVAIGAAVELAISENSAGVALPRFKLSSKA